MIRYVVLINEKFGAYSLTVPDLPGCTSAGSTIGEVLSNAAEDVRRWITDTGINSRPRAHNDIVADERVKAALAGGAMLAIVVLPPEPETTKPGDAVDRRRNGAKQAPIQRFEATDRAESTPDRTLLKGRGTTSLN